MKIVRDIRMRLTDPEGYILRDYYNPLRNGIKRTHWATGDIQTFRDGFIPFLDRTRQDKKEHYRAIGQSYIDFWEERDGSYFQVRSVDVEIGGLTILVTPEVGMRIGDDSYTLKIWLNSQPPTRAARQVIQHSMERASEICDSWDTSWHLGIWDIRRKNILPPMRTARDFELGLTGQAAAFLQIWNKLDQIALSYSE